MTRDEHTLQNLKIEEKELEAKLQANRNWQFEINKADFWQKYGIQPGDHIEYGSPGARARATVVELTRYSNSHTEPHKLIIKKFKKDGTPGETQASLSLFWRYSKEEGWTTTSMQQNNVTKI